MKNYTGLGLSAQFLHVIVKLKKLKLSSLICSLSKPNGTARDQHKNTLIGLSVMWCIVLILPLGIDSTSCSTQNEYIGVNAFNVVIMLTVKDAVIYDFYTMPF